ncbi:hypothetical protein GWO13_09275 [Candidatus Bathyarchaeota archaeon]|nr:hypothetical protein [Candidatus Bathyarchaeota archaeon]
MKKRKIEVKIPDNLDKLIEALAMFLHKKPDDLLSKVILDAVQTLPNNLDQYIDSATIRKIYNV